MVSEPFPLASTWLLPPPSPKPSQARSCKGADSANCEPAGALAPAALPFGPTLKHFLDRLPKPACLEHARDA